MTPADPARLALSLRKESKLGDAPIDIFGFLNTRDDVFLIRRFAQGANIDGIYVKDSRDDVGFIYLNRAKPLGRQHFTAAHEFGHHLLGHHEEIDADIFALAQSDEEKAANRFAAELLIPRPGLIKFVTQERLDVSRLPDAIRVAQHFGVSLQPVLIQLRNVDRLSGLDHGRLLREFDGLTPNPLAEWENVSAPDKTEFPPRYVEHIKVRYVRAEITDEAASDALDVPIEVVHERFGPPPESLAPSDISDLL